MLQYTKQNLILGGDWNCIINDIDCTSYPELKRSKTLKRLITMHKLHDTYRKLHPKTRNYSRYYSKTENTQGATRLDRIYTSKHIVLITAKHMPNAFLDHYC